MKLGIEDNPAGNQPKMTIMVLQETDCLVNNNYIGAVNIKIGLIDKPETTPKPKLFFFSDVLDQSVV